MKKLIAILIILIFSFESMGYSLPDSVRRGNLRAPAGIDSRRIFYAQGKLKHKKPPYQNFPQALETLKKGDISWGRTTDDIRLKFIETLAEAKEVDKKPGQLNTNDFKKHLPIFSGKSIYGLLRYYMRTIGTKHLAIALKSLKEKLGIEDIPIVPYQGFPQALEAVKKEDISWERTITDDNGIWREFIETLADAVDKDPRELTTADFERPLPVFDWKTIKGLLICYTRMIMTKYHAIALKSLKERLGIEDLLVPRQEWQERTTDWNAVYDIIEEHMAVDVTKDNIERYLTDKNTELTKAAQLALGREVQKGNAAAREALIIAYLERVKSFAAWYHSRNQDIGEDKFYDVCLGALIGCVERFDPDRDVAFKAYCSIRIQYSMKDLIRDKRGYRRSNKTREVPIDENMGSIDARGNNHGIPSIPIEEAGLILSNAGISERDIGIFNSFFYEDSKQIDIAKRIVPELTPGRVSQIIAKCVEILKQQLNGPVRYKIPINGNNRQGI